MGKGFAILIGAENYIFATGTNDWGQLGLGDKTDRDQFTRVKGILGNPKDVSCGGNQSIILTEDGGVFAAGDNSLGQLGLGPVVGANTFQKVTLPPGLGTPFAVSCGGNQSIILTEDGGVFATGENTYGQLGLGPVGRPNTFQKVTFPPGLGTPFAVSCGEQHSIILTDQGVFATGRNDFGSVGLGLGDEGQFASDRNQFSRVPDNLGTPFAVSCGFHSSIILTDRGVFATGSNYLGRLGLGDNKDHNRFVPVQGIFGTPFAVSCGNFHSIILTAGEGGGVFATGNNSLGQLGLGDNVNRNLFEQVQGIFGSPFAVSCGGGYSIILTDEDGVFVAGSNRDGQQFGLGNNPNHNHNHNFTFQHLNIEPIIAQIPYFPGTLETLAARRHYFAYYHPEGSTSQDIRAQLVQGDLPGRSIDNYINAINFTAVG